MKRPARNAAVTMVAAALVALCVWAFVSVHGVSREIHSSARAPSATHAGTARQFDADAAARRKRHSKQSVALRVSRPLPATNVAPKYPKYLVLIVLDGAQAQYLGVPGIPHVRSLIRNGTQYASAFAGILESETPSGHAVIDTGSQPRENGILSFDWVNSDNLPVTLFDERTVRAGNLERLMKQATAPSLAGLVHARYPRARVVALSGYKYYAADALGGPHADVIMYYAARKNGTFGPTAVPGHVPPRSLLNAPDLIAPSRHTALGEGDHLAMELANRTFQTLHQKVTLINLPEFDWPLGHVDGAGLDAPAVSTLMRGFDRDLAALEATYRKAGVLDQTLFVLTADHGFAPVPHKVSHRLVAAAVRHAGTSIIRDAYHTGGYLWLRDKSKAVDVAATLSHDQNPFIQAVYFRSIGPVGPVYLRATGPDLLLAPGMESANQYLLNTFNGPNGPDVVILMKEDAALMFAGQSTWKGDHGGANWNAQHVPLVLSGPGVRRGYVSTYPAPLMDLAPTVLTLLGAPVTGVQGVPLADALRQASTAQWSRQHIQGAVLRPVVTALQAESRLELAIGR